MCTATGNLLLATITVSIVVTVYRDVKSRPRSIRHLTRGAPRSGRSVGVGRWGWPEREGGHLGADDAAGGMNLHPASRGALLVADVGQRDDAAHLEAGNDAGHDSHL